MKRLLAVATAALMLTAGAASAQTQTRIKPADQADLECMAVAAYYGGIAEEGSQEQAGLVGGLMYYLGKLRGRSPDVDWLARLRELVMAMEVTDVEALGPRCGGEMTRIGDELLTWGNEMAGVEAGK